MTLVLFETWMLSSTEGAASKGANSEAELSPGRLDLRVGKIVKVEKVFVEIYNIYFQSQHVCFF